MPRLLEAVCASLITAPLTLVNAAAVSYSNEANFIAATSGLTLSLEGFETPFVAAPTVHLGGFPISVNNATDLGSRAS